MEAANRGGIGGNRGNPDYSSYFKIGLIIAAGVMSILVIVWLVMMIINAAQGPAPVTPERPAADTTTAEEETIVLVALGEVNVRVTQTSNNEDLFYGTLARGERKPISRRGPVLVVYNPGINLQVEIKGRLHRMTGGDGIGRSTIP